MSLVHNYSFLFLSFLVHNWVSLVHNLCLLQFLYHNVCVCLITFFCNSDRYTCLSIIYVYWSSSSTLCNFISFLFTPQFLCVLIHNCASLVQNLCLFFVYLYPIHSYFVFCLHHSLCVLIHNWDTTIYMFVSLPYFAILTRTHVGG